MKAIKAVKRHQKRATGNLPFLLNSVVVEIWGAVEREMYV